MNTHPLLAVLAESAHAAALLDADLGSSAPAPAWLSFQAQTGCGAVGLSITRAPDADPATEATGIEQVLRLAEAEPLIRAVEDWLQSPWDPAPADESDAPHQAVVRDPALAPPGTRLSVPPAAWRIPLPAALCAPALAWGVLPAQLCLSPVPDAALDQLQPGSVLWLPSAFGALWPVQLIDSAGRLPPCPAHLDLRAPRLSVSPGSDAEHAAVPGGEPPLCVVLKRYIPIPLDHWMGAHGADTALQVPLPQPWAAELRRGAVRLASGSLLPLGQGCGLLIDAVVPGAADA